MQIKCLNKQLLLKNANFEEKNSVLLKHMHFLPKPIQTKYLFKKNKGSIFQVNSVKKNQISS